MQNSDWTIAIDLIIGLIACCIYCVTKSEKEDSTPIVRRRPATPYRPSSAMKKPIPGVAQSVTAVDQHLTSHSENVRIARGGEFIGNRMRFKVKVLNDSRFVISDITIFLISYPKESLRLDDDTRVLFSKIEPSGFRSPKFDFLPTQDCVKGEIIAGVSYIDERGKAHTLTAKPFAIRSVCDLLIPDQITPQEYSLKLEDHECGEIVVKVDEWTAEEMYEKSLRILEDANFFEVDSNIEIKDGIVFASIHGFAKGKYTGKSIGIEILVSGPSSKKGASCTLRVSGEDQAMILPAIDDLKERLSAWLCPLCGSQLTLANVEDLKDGKVILCPFCSVSIGR